MENRTRLTKILHRLSQSIDRKDTSFKRKLFNLYLSGMMFLDVKRIIYSEEESKAFNIINFIKYYYNLIEGYENMKGRKRDHLKYIYIAIKFIYDNTKLPLDDIGLIFNNRDHATILHAVKTIDNRMDTEKKFKAEYENLLKLKNLKYHRYEKGTRL